MAFTSRTVGLARAAITAVGRVIDATVRALTAAWVRTWDTLAALFSSAVEDMVADAEEWPGRRTVETHPALQDALDAAQRALDALTDLVVTETTRAADTVIDRAADDQAGLVVGGAVDHRVGGAGRFRHHQVGEGVQRALRRVERVLQGGVGLDGAAARPLLRVSDHVLHRAAEQCGEGVPGADPRRSQSADGGVDDPAHSGDRGAGQTHCSAGERHQPDGCGGAHPREISACATRSVTAT